MLSQFTSAASQQINDLLQVVNARDKVCGGILFLSCSCEILSPGVSVSLQHAQKDEEARPTLNVHVAEPPDVIESLKLGRQERRVSYHIRARARVRRHSRGRRVRDCGQSSLCYGGAEQRAASCCFWKSAKRDSASSSPAASLF